MAILNNLIVNGASRFLNKTYMDTLNINEIEADKGKFNQLAVKDVTATNATVLGLMDIKGELHTNTWTNSNIATIDGSFYITPTIGLTDNGTANVTANAITFTGTSYSFTSIYTNKATSSTTSTVAWTAGSKILITGEVQVGGEWMPFGTLTGFLGTTSSTSVAVNTLKANRPATVTSNPETLAAIISAAAEAGVATTALPYRNVKISMYQTNRTANGTTYYPLGIYMSALGANGRTFIDIYGGNNAYNSTGYPSAMALPVVRIGNLSSMNLPKVGGIDPNGWGIYTSNGFFKGTVAAEQGKIGKGTKIWTIGSNGDNRSFIYSGPSAIDTTTEGIYIGTDGIWDYKSSAASVKIKDGVITAQGANIQGQITATSGKIGNASNTTNQINIGTNTNNASIATGGHPSLASTANGFYLGTDGLSIGSGFNVTTAGILNATDAIITGEITAKNFSALDSYNQKRVEVTDAGLKIYDGQGILDNNIVAKFGIDGATIGVVGKSYVNIDFHSMKLIDANRSPYFIANDLRDASGLSVIKQTFKATYGMYDDSSKIYPIYTPVTQIIDVVDENEESWLDEVSIDLENAGTDDEYFDISTRDDVSGTQLTIIYKSTSVAYNYLLGTYKVGGNAGPYSTVIGKNNEASGVASIAEGANTSAKGFGCHAEGVGTLATYSTDYAEQVGAHAEGVSSKAYGLGAHAEGYDTQSTYKAHAQNEGTRASRVAQTAIGTYNTIDISPTTTHPNQQHSSYGKYALSIGNGTSDDARSDALTVDWKGRVECGNYAGNFKSIFDIFYPVGSYYETSLSSAIPSGSTTPTDTDLSNLGVTWFDPQYAWGGTWALDSTGRVTVARNADDTSFDTIGEKGGAKTVTLTTSQIPEHTHGMSHTHSHNHVSSGYMSAKAATGTARAIPCGRTNEDATGTFTSDTDATASSKSSTDKNTNGGGAHNNMPPYIVVNRWHRVG